MLVEQGLEDLPLPSSFIVYIFFTDQDADESSDKVSEDSSLDETDIDFLEDAEIEKDVFRTKTFMYVSDLARKSPRVLAKVGSLLGITCLPYTTVRSSFLRPRSKASDLLALALLPIMKFVRLFVRFYSI